MSLVSGVQSNFYTNSGSDYSGIGSGLPLRVPRNDDL